MRSRFGWIFACSGLAGLIYEIIWTRYLSLLVGHSAYAQAIVLVVFLGGMAIGSVLVADRSSRLRDPLRGYALVEALLGITGLAFHPVYTTVTDLAYTHVFPSMGPGATVRLLQWGIAAALILPQSILLGMSFPLMSAGVLRRLPATVAQGRSIALLYFCNSLGGAVGVLLTGFLFVTALGLRHTLTVAALINAGVAWAAWRSAARTPLRVASQTPEEPITETVPAAVESDPAPDVPPERLWVALLVVSGGTAVASFAYEVAWTRMLALVLGSATHAFELMLSAFILGLAIGALWMRRTVDTLRAPVRRLAIVQLIMGALAIATIPVYLKTYALMSALVLGLPKTATGYAIFNMARYGLSLAVMLPATICAGMTLPLISASLLRRGAGERTIGTVYGANAMGSIVGVGAAVLLLLPLVGLKALLVVAGTVDMCLGVGVLVLLRPADRTATRILIPAVLLTLVLASGAFASGRFDPLLLASGVFRKGRLEHPDGVRMVYYRDGRTASVSVTRSVTGQVTIATNGKPDASFEGFWFQPPTADSAARPTLQDDESTQTLLPLITWAHMPRARRAAVIGHGSGQSAHLLLANAQLQQLTTVEIEPQMIFGSRAFFPLNRRVFEDRRATFAIDDARAYFAATGPRFDLVLSEPSNPWVSGVSGLFTEEFYRGVRASLTPHGVFGQWMHIYEMSDALVLSVLHAVHRVFPDYRVYQTDSGDLLIVAAARGALTDPDWSILQAPDVRSALAPVQPIMPDQLAANLLFTRADVAPLFSSAAAARFPANTDGFPVLDQAAEAARFLDAFAAGIAAIAQDRFDIVAALADRRRPLGTTTWPSTGGTRSTLLAASASLRAGRPGIVSSDNVREQYQQLRDRLSVFTERMASGKAPTDWYQWILWFVDLDLALHSGASGVVDPDYFVRCRRFAEVAHAPAEVRAVMTFVEAVATYDWKTAAAQVDALLPTFRTKHPAMPREQFRYAASVALLKAGEPQRARTILERDPGLGQPPADLRTWLVQAHLDAARTEARDPRPR